MSDKEAFEKIYEKPNKAIWTKKEPPAILRSLVETKAIKPCKTLDIACGEGFYSIYLSNNGFDVLGIDFSKKAIEYAKQNAKKAGTYTSFLTLDVNDLEKQIDKFDFVFEWGLIHHLPQEQLNIYVRNVNNLIKPEGIYLSATFNINSDKYGNTGQKLRRTPIGTSLTYYSLNEMKQLFSPYFKILSEQIIPLEGREEMHISQPGNVLLMRKLR